MIRVVFFILAIGVCTISFAGGNAKQVSEQSNEEFLHQVSLDLQKASIIIPSMEKEIAELRVDTADYKKQIRQLQTKEMSIKGMLTSRECCKILMKYPLTQQYDSVLVAKSLEVITYFNINNEKINKDYCNLMMPYLKGYRDYNEEIYALLEKIKVVYFGSIRKNYPLDQFEKEILKTKYGKKCGNDGIEGIPYLSDVIRRTQDAASAGKLSKELLQDLMNELK